MTDFGIAYSGTSDSYNIILKDFTEESIPRTYSNENGLSVGLAGSTILTGPSYAQKRIWAISAVVDKETALDIDAMFRSWDEDRSNGVAAACGIVDRTFGPDVSADVIFSTAPSFQYINKNYIVVSFGLTEV
jgi:hypothetical protein